MGYEFKLSDHCANSNGHVTSRGLRGGPRRRSVIALTPSPARARLDLGAVTVSALAKAPLYSHPPNSLRTMASMTSMPSGESFSAGR